MKHIKQGLINPRCDGLYDFDIEKLGAAEFIKGKNNAVDPLKRKNMAERLFSDPASKWSRTEKFNYTKYFKG